MPEMESTAEKQTASSPSALVTGANKGIGYGVTRNLSHDFKGTVYLTARDEAKGLEAVHALARDDRLAQFLQLDVTDRGSIERARDHIVKTHGGLDVLVNNAGISGFDFHSVNLTKTSSSNRTLEGIIKNAMPDGVITYSPEMVRLVVETNFFGVVNVCEILFPILRSHARVVNLSSALGTLRSLGDEQAGLKQRLVADDLTVDELKEIMRTYVKIAETQNPAELGYPAFGPFAFSKMGVTALTRVYQRMFDADKTRYDIIINAVTPGFCATEMTAYKGTHTIEDGTDSPVFLAMLPKLEEGKVDEDIPRGQFVRDRVPVDWAGEKDKF